MINGQGLWVERSFDDKGTVQEILGGNGIVLYPFYGGGYMNLCMFSKLIHAKKKKKEFYCM